MPWPQMPAGNVRALQRRMCFDCAAKETRPGSMQWREQKKRVLSGLCLQYRPPDPMQECTVFTNRFIKLHTIRATPPALLHLPRTLPHVISFISCLISSHHFPQNHFQRLQSYSCLSFSLINCAFSWEHRKDFQKAASARGSISYIFHISLPLLFPPPPPSPHNVLHNSMLNVLLSTYLCPQGPGPAMII